MAIKFSEKKYRFTKFTYFTKIITTNNYIYENYTNNVQIVYKNWPKVYQFFDLHP